MKSSLDFKIILGRSHIKISPEDALQSITIGKSVFYKILPFSNYEIHTLKKYVETRSYEEINKILSVQWILEVINNQWYNLFTDRLGIYSIYYVKKNNTFIFSNKIKLLFEDLENKEINKQKLYELFLIRYTYGSNTLIKNIYKTNGSQIFTNIDNKTQIIHNNIIKIKNYLNVSDAELENMILNKLFDIVKQYKEILELNYLNTTNLLSGGVDSSIVQYVLNNILKGRIKTLSTSNDWVEFDESDYAIEASKILNTDHTLISITLENFKQNLEKSILLNQEPIALYQGVAYGYIANKIPDNFNFIFSGFGADLAFGEGLRKIKYSSYLKILPKIILIAIINYIHNPKLKYFFNFAYKFNSLKDEIDKLIFLQVVNDEERVKEILGFNVSLAEVFESRIDLFKKYADINFYDRLILVEFLTHNNRVTSHWNGVLNGKKMLFPFLDHQFINFVLSIPVKQKVFSGKLKHHLKNICASFSSKKFAYRKKKTGSLPIKKWIYEDEYLRYWTFEYPNPYLDTKVLLKDSNDRYFDQLLWTALNFNIWYNNFIK